MQLDLFLHGADVSLRNEVVAALSAHDEEALHGAIERLRAAFPDDVHLEEFENVYAELTAVALHQPCALTIAQQLEIIETRLLPSLIRVLGADSAQRWSEPVYSTLASRALAQPFERSQANTHTTRLSLKAGELSLARASVVKIPSWRRIPEPLTWMCEIAFRENIPAEYWPLSAELAWIAPALLEPLIRAHAPASVGRLYRAFLAAADFGEEDNEAAWFPAWLLIEHTDLLPMLRTAQADHSRPARSASLLIDLLLGERHGATSALVAKRAQLRDLSPMLFEFYMARR